MAELFKEIKSRIALKLNTYQYWTEGEGKDHIPLYGEICLCEIPGPVENEQEQTNGSQHATTAPTVLFKVGMGKKDENGDWLPGTDKKFSELNWVSALAADVYDWAKKSEEEFLEWIGEQGIATVTITRKTGDTEVETTYTLQEYVDTVIGNLDNLTTTHKDNLVNAINDAIQAINVGGTGSVVTIAEIIPPTEGSSATYQLYQGVDAEGNPVPVGTKIEIPYVFKFVVENSSELNDSNFKTYEGIVVYVKSEKTYYQLKDNAWKALFVASETELEGKIKDYVTGEALTVMEFKGITSALPDTTGLTKGDFYKVAGEFLLPAENNAEGGSTTVLVKVGDSIIYNGNAKWYRIPSGDHIEDTWRPVKAGGNTLENSEALEFVAGENVTITEVDGKVTISSTNTDTDTHHQSKLIIGNEKIDTVDEDVAENNNVHLNLVENGEVRSSHKIVGAGGVTVTHTKAASEGGENVITITAPDGAKYNLTAKLGTGGEDGKAFLSLTGTDNSEAKVALVGDETVEVTVENGEIIISAQKIIGSETDEATANTIYGVKKYYANQAAVVLSEAQKYTDNAVGNLHKIATTGSIYDINEVNIHKEEGKEDILYILLDCNW